MVVQLNSGARILTMDPTQVTYTRDTKQDEVGASKDYPGVAWALVKAMDIASCGAMVVAHPCDAHATNVILSNASPHWKDTPGFQRRSTTTIQELLDKDMRQSAAGGEIAIGLHDAAEKGLTAVVERIFDRTMDLNIDMKDKYDRTPLHWAAECGHVDTCIMLIDLGAEASQKEGMGRTCIHLAARSGHLAVVKAVLGKYEDDEEEILRMINDEDNNGLTPYFLARQRGDEEGLEVFEWMLMNGANYDTNKWAEVEQMPPVGNPMA